MSLTNMLSYISHQYVVIYFKMYFRIYVKYCKIGRFKYVKIYVAHIWQLIWPIYLTTIYAHIWDSNTFLSIWNHICGPYMSKCISAYILKYYKIGRFKYVKIYVAHIWQLIWPIYLTTIYARIWDSNTFLSIWNHICGSYMSKCIPNWLETCI